MARRATGQVVERRTKAGRVYIPRCATAILAFAFAVVPVAGCGTDQATVPDVVGESRPDATDEIRAAGLEPKVRGGASRLDLSGDSDGGLDLSPFIVQAQNPDGGVEVEPGSTVKLTVK